MKRINLLLLELSHICKMGTHKYTTLQNINKKRQRGKGRPRKKIYWREDKRKNEQKEKRKRDEEKKQENLQLVTAILTSQQNDIDEGRDGNVMETDTVTTSSVASAGSDQQGEIDSLDLNASDNDIFNDWGGDGTDHNAQEIRVELERVVAEGTQSLHLSLDRRMELVNIIYRLVHKCTGMIGGNGHGAAMYGEMMKASMQRVVEKLISDTGLSTSSRFLDVGCGLGKPQLHVAQMAHVEFSYGIDIDELRVFLANLNLKRIMKEAMTTNFDINTRCLVMHGDIEVARVFDPFTHVYMFDVA